MNDNEIEGTIALEPLDDKDQPAANADGPLPEKIPALGPLKEKDAPLFELQAGEGMSFGIRAGAYIIDTIIFNAVIFGGGVVGVAALSIILVLVGRLLVPESAESELTLNGYLVGLALSTVYFCVFEWLYGATPGKLILRMRVVREDGDRPRLWQTLVRGMFRYVDGLFFGLPAGVAMSRDERRQRFGDRYAHTIVVDRGNPVIRQGRSRVWFAVAVGFCLLFLSAAGTLLGLQNAHVVPLLASATASELNLSVSDLEGEYSLEAEVGKEAFDEDQITDASVRLFTNDQVNVQAQVLTFPFVVFDKIEDLVAAMQQELVADEGNEELSFEPLTTAGVGDRAGVLRFSRPSTDEEGFVFYFVRRNVMVRLVSYGVSGTMSDAELLRLATLIDGRIR